MNHPAGVLLLSGLLCASAPAAYDLFPLTCSSEEGGYKHCAADTSRGVRLATKWAGSQACRPGYSWGFDEEGVWVDRGCRAQFAEGNGRASYIQPGEQPRTSRSHDGAGEQERPRSGRKVLTCSSEDGGRQYCKAETRSGVTMVRQRSGSPCKESYSWGFDERGVWVDHGCRADFALGGRGKRLPVSRMDASDGDRPRDRGKRLCQMSDSNVRMNSDGGWSDPDCVATRYSWPCASWGRIRAGSSAGEIVPGDGWASARE